MTDKPPFLDLWKRPAHYIGASWSSYYVFVGRNRDSDCLTNCNFEVALEQIGGETETVIVVSENHYLVGWIEWIAIHKDDSKALTKANEIAEKLEDYPVVCVDALSEAEMEEANEIWNNCYDNKERIEYIREHRSQFEFHSYEDMLCCCRGKYFSGYASELIYR